MDGDLHCWNVKMNIVSSDKVRKAQTTLKITSLVAHFPLIISLIEFHLPLSHLVIIVTVPVLVQQVILILNGFCGNKLCIRLKRHKTILHHYFFFVPELLKQN